MKQVIDQDWQDWISLNISRGCDKDGIVKILFEHGFDPAVIVATMRYLPQSGELVAAMNLKLASNSQPTTEALEETAVYRAIDAVTLPFARRMETTKAHFYLLEDFLSTGECDELVRRICLQHRDSTITNPDEPDKYFRTSKTSDMSQNADAFIEDISRRIADYMGFEPERSESIQGQYYQVGDQFKTHTDYFEPNTAEYRKFAGSRGQRTWTFMVYLNEVEAGGVTEFPRLPLAVTPKKGMAVIWNSLHADGSVNPDTAHWAKPVTQGEKFIITKWFRTYGNLTSPFKAASWRKIPAFTREGFRKSSVPEELGKALSTFYATHRQASLPEASDAIGSYIRTKDKRPPARMIDLDATLRAPIAATLKPLLEAWVCQPLRTTAVYGIREYQQGATLDMHIDRMETHIISAILNVAQEVSTEWPLFIHDHFGRRHAVFLKPGEMLLYESARLQHGRPEPLDGANFANVFVHAMPE